MLLYFAPLTAGAQHLTWQPHTGVEVIPIGEDVYAYLRHLSVRGLVTGYSEIQLPLSEYEVRSLLQSVQSEDLSNAERALLTKYLQTYAHAPREAATVFPSTDAESFFSSAFFSDRDKYLYRWFDDSTKSDLFVHAIGSIEERTSLDPKGSVLLGVIGGQFNGTLSGHVGYYLRATNGEKFGDDSLVLEDPVLAKNRNLLYYSRTFFDFTSAELTYNYDWFTGKIAREAVAIGGSYQGDNVVLSPNVPYFDFVSLAGHVGAVRYEAIVGSLLADTLTGGAGASIPDKFITAHDLTFAVGRDIELGFTDMVIFSRRFDLAYLNPFSFLKSVEHALNDRDNGLLGLHARWKIADGFELRGQGLMDDWVAGKTGQGYWSNKFAWQFGAMWAGALGLRDLDWMVEATRVEPYMYSHFSRDNTFSTTQTLLGAQIGPNAISYWTGLRWAASEKLTLRANAEYIERGENVYDSTGHLVYNAGGDYLISRTDETQEMNTHILYGRRVNSVSLSGTVEYEPWRGLVVFASGTKKSVDYLNEPPVTPGIDLSSTTLSTVRRERPQTTLSVGIRALF